MDTGQGANNMNLKEFRKYGHYMVDRMADFFENIEQYPVKSKVNPGDIKNNLPLEPPERGEPFEAIMKDFDEIIMPGMTHWQHPKFFAYFPANSSYPSVLGEMLTAALGAQCMIWQTSPAAAELEERTMQWLRQIIGLPPGFDGVIQDSASSSTLCSLLTARERLTGYSVNDKGFPKDKTFTVYCSEETHSSIEKGVKIAGFGRENIRKIPVDEKFALIPEKLEEAIAEDRKAGLVPCCTVATIGTTGSTAIDPLLPIGKICSKYGVWLHVDAALAGSAMVLPEFRWMIEGIEYADTFVFNPHKWMFTNFDCSAYFAKDTEALVRTFEIMPEYLKTGEGKTVNDYRDWGIPLGRRFRALKLWFVLRSFGVDGIKATIKKHIDLTKDVVSWIEEAEDFELLAPVPLNTICFRYTPTTVDGGQDGHALASSSPESAETTEKLNKLNARLLEKINSTGEAFFTHTKLNGKYTIRFVIGQTYVEKRHVKEGWKLITETARSMTP